MTPEQLFLFCCMLIGVTFTIGAFGKLVDVQSFKEAIKDFNILPVAWINLASALILGGEILVIVTLVFGGVWSIVGFISSIILLVIFSVAISVALFRRTNVNCNCFGRTATVVSAYDIMRNIILLLCSLTGLYLTSTSPTNMYFEYTEIVLIFFPAFCLAHLITNIAPLIYILLQPLPNT